MVENTMHKHSKIIDAKSIKIVSPELIPTQIEKFPENLIEIFKVCTVMERICTDFDGIGLSAVQVGIPWDLFIVLKEEKYEYYLNCKYKGVGDKITSIEGCLSLRNKDGVLRRFEVMRYPLITLEGKQLIVSEKGLELIDISCTIKDGLYPIVFQHEIDHSTSILISEIGKEIELR